MCKILAIAGINPARHKQLKKFLKAAAPHLSEMDRHGLGYAAVNEHGLYMEKWINPEHAFTVRNAVNYEPEELRAVKVMEPVTGPSLGYECSGKFQPNNFKGTTSVIMHTRWATNGGIALRNTHPFVSGNTALIHNGVIMNQDKLVNITGECDSECILNEYLQRDVDINPKNIEKVAANLLGAFACAVLTEDATGRFVMDVFRNTGSDLVWSFIKELGQVVFCTSDDILRAICKDAKFTIGTIHTYLPGKLFRMDARTGVPIDNFNFKASVGYYPRLAAADYDYANEVGYTSEYSRAVDVYTPEELVAIHAAAADEDDLTIADYAARRDAWKQAQSDANGDKSEREYQEWLAQQNAEAEADYKAWLAREERPDGIVEDTREFDAEVKARLKKVMGGE